MEKSYGKHVETVFTNSGIGKKFSERGFGDGNTVSAIVRSDTERKVRKSFNGVRKEAKFAMGSSGRVQPDEDFVTHAGRKGAG